MIKKFLIVLTALIMLFSLNSCNVYTYPTAQEDIYVETQANVVRSNVDFNVVMHYGTPYWIPNRTHNKSGYFEGSHI